MTGMSAETVSVLGKKGFAAGSVACVTGGAQGIGLAAACRFGALGMTVVVIDTDTGQLARAEKAITDAGAAEVATYTADVSSAKALQTVEGQIADRFGGVDVLMVNAGIQPGSKVFGSLDNWQRIIGVNLWGVINGVHAFAPVLVEQGTPAAMVNTL